MIVYSAAAVLCVRLPKGRRQDAAIKELRMLRTVGQLPASARWRHLVYYQSIPPKHPQAVTNELELLRGVLPLGFYEDRDRRSRLSSGLSTFLCKLQDRPGYPSLRLNPRKRTLGQNKLREPAIPGFGSIHGKNRCEQFGNHVLLPHPVRMPIVGDRKKDSRSAAAMDVQ